MLAAVVVLLRSLRLICSGHRAVALENLALRQQLSVFRRTVTRPPLRTSDRLFWVLLAKAWQDWRTALIVVQPDTSCVGTSFPIGPCRGFCSDVVVRGLLHRADAHRPCAVRARATHPPTGTCSGVVSPAWASQRSSKDALTTRRVQTPTEGPVVAFPEVGGLHHRYERRAA